MTGKRAGDPPGQRAIVIEGYDTESIQRRTLGVLRLSSAFSRGAVSASFPVAVLAIEDLLGDARWAGLSTGASTLGSALAAGTLATFMQRRGRTLGLTVGLAVAILGTLMCILAIETSTLALFMVGMICVGVGSGTSNLSRYAAADLATDARRGRDISSVIFFATFGAVAFPFLIGVLGDVAEGLGLDRNSGGFGMGAALFAISSLAIFVFMRPDPLVVSGGVDPSAEARKRRPVPFREAVAIAWQHPLSRLAFMTLVISQAVMVSVMAMTPVHMKAHDHELGIIGAVIASHTAGMFAFAPFAGWLSDRFGRLPVIGAAGVTLSLATVFTTFAGDAPAILLFPGLFLLGLGWSFGVVAGSALLTESVGEKDRVAVQGAADLATNIASGMGALASGVILSMTGYHILSLVGMAAAAGLLGHAWFENRLATVRPGPIT